MKKADIKGDRVVYEQVKITKILKNFIFILGKGSLW